MYPYTYMLSIFTYYICNISIFACKRKFEHKLTNQFQTYLLTTFILIKKKILVFNLP
jgi:hypothetical protein